MNKYRKTGFSLFLILIFVLSACSSPTSTLNPTNRPGGTPVPTESLPTPTSPEPTATVISAESRVPLYLSIIWHQHQPVYFKDPETGVYVKPWVRVHAAKDYVDMAAILEKYPEIHATFNLTPSLIRQLDDLEAGAKDLYWVKTEIPADQLNDEDQQFILDHFFDTNSNIIARFPRYEELRAQRDSGVEFTSQDFLDLQMLFNLAWLDPDWLAIEPMAGLVTKGRSFTEADKEVVLQEHARLIAEVIPIHKRLQDAGQIEVTTTPYTHPILPLLVDTNLAQIALPDINLPTEKFSQPEDAAEQVANGVKIYEEHFNRQPRGMWPGEGSVAEDIVPLVAQNNIVWMASDEGVLAYSLGLKGFTRDENETVLLADRLYRPYYVQGADGGPVAMVFRDVVISDKVGFAYSGMDGDAAAQDFVNRIHAISDSLQANGSNEPRLVSVILDGENAWEHYPNDGKEFLNSLYTLLSTDPTIKTVTPGEFISMFPDQAEVKNLWAGSWINHDFSTWIGEEEENLAWDLLKSTRDFLAEYESGAKKPPSPEALERAKDLMFIAEGSDWFWWYGNDQSSGDDEAFDQQYRDTLKEIYRALGEEPPLTLDAPVIPEKALTADQAAIQLITPAIDGIDSPGEWDGAGIYLASGGAMAAANPYFESLSWGFDQSDLYFKITSVQQNTHAEEHGIELYMAVPGGGNSSNFSRNETILGFSANRLVEIQMSGSEIIGANLYMVSPDGTWDEVAFAMADAALGQDVIEIAVLLKELGALEIGDSILLRGFHTEGLSQNGSVTYMDTDQIPGTGPAQVIVPDLSNTTVLLEINDPANDDHGPGTYSYPTDNSFKDGLYDILNFQVGEDDENIVFKFTMRGPVDNPWGSPSGLSVQTFDIYIDQDGNEKGGKEFLPGRNISLQEEFAWDVAITAEGWEPGIFLPGETGLEKIAGAGQFDIQVDPGTRQVTIRIPKEILGNNPQDWRFAAVVLGQDGYPASGVMRVRDVNPDQAQWRFGGAPEGTTNHTRVIDMVWAEEGKQETWLEDFELSGENSFARIPMFAVPE